MCLVLGVGRKCQQLQILCLGWWPLFCHTIKSLQRGSTGEAGQSSWVQVSGSQLLAKGSGPREDNSAGLCWRHSLGSRMHPCCSTPFHTVPSSSGKHTQAQIHCTLGLPRAGLKALKFQRQGWVCGTSIHFQQIFSKQLYHAVAYLT